MTYIIRPMDEDEITAIAGWHYPPPYDFNDWTKESDDPAQLLDARRWPDRFFAAHGNDDDLVGFFEFQVSGEWATIGLGLRPDLTGKGMGLPFIEAGLAFARERFQVRHFHLTVATFNERAITVYERAGFVREEIIPHLTNGQVSDFLHMRRYADESALPGT